MMRWSPRAAVLLTVLLGTMPACRCGSSLTGLEPGVLAVTPTALNFPATYVGARASASVEVSNHGQQRVLADASVAAPFFLQMSTLSVLAGQSQQLAVQFAPTQGGHFETTLEVGALKVSLTADALELTVCTAGVCQTSVFDPTAAVCRVAPKPDGDACQSRCVVGGCRAGTCVGSLRGCDDLDVCTADSCSELDGCLHAPVECTAPTNPCQQARCVSPGGCAVDAVPDGTLCGPDDCLATQVDICIAAQCVRRPRPATGRCSNRWVPTALFARSRHAMVWDTARKRLVLFGGYANAILNDTWEWDGAHWERRTPVTSPPGRFSHAMAYDSARKKVVLFGGTVGTGPGAIRALLADTWEWDGTNWVERFPNPAPPMRDQHTMAYDPVRRRVVLFGGIASTTTIGTFSDTWEWDGSSWLERPFPLGPAPRTGHCMTFDSVKHRVVLFGGAVGPSTHDTNETWFWSGTNWVLGAHAPVYASHCSLAFDEARNRVVLFGGQANPGTWEFDGTVWTQASSTATESTMDLAMAWDPIRQRVVRFGGVDSGSGALLDRTLEWNGTTWTERPVPPAPSFRTNQAMAWDRAHQRVVLFGGYGNDYLQDTWLWDGAGWSSPTPALSPQPRAGQSLVWDTATGKLLLFGGRSQSSTVAETWLWDGTTWAQASPALSPATREGASIASDEARHRIVLFGGSGTTTLLGDTWEWDGSTWVEQKPMNSPLPRQSAAMAWDRLHQRVVLFGGGTGSGFFSPFGDTWEWDGNDWQLRTPATSPPARSGGALAWDEARQRIVLHGGTEPVIQSFNDTWEWDGTTWSERTLAESGPAARYTMAWDETRQRLVAFGPGTWVLLP